MTSPYVVSIGKRIRELRTEAEMTLESLSEATNISVGYLSDVERGKYEPTITKIQAIAKALKIKIDRLCP